MTLLDAHLVQISLCSATIGELAFPPSGIFANALLRPHDITALIRDTESHERALFSVPPPPKATAAQELSALPADNRRATVFNAPRRNTAVAAILGSELVERIREGGGGGGGLGQRPYARARGGGAEIDVETLLEGAEKLSRVYHIPGVTQRIEQLRQRQAQLVSSIEHYESRIADQQTKLAHINESRGEYGAEAEVGSAKYETGAEVQGSHLTLQDITREEDEIRALERQKQQLEHHIRSISKEVAGGQKTLR